ncbi:MAG: GNAT family N-acetyltransferase [Tissierellia bacterium]|nr:GNAT family N-acetyltransferase [Tissierellia bacterium]
MIKKFKELTVEELYGILQLRSEVFVVEQKCIYEDLDGKDLEALHLYEQEKDQIIAYCRIMEVDPYTFWIGRVVVAKAFRRQQKATLLLKRGLNYILKKAPQGEIHLSAQVMAMDFYSSLGFIPCGDSYVEDGIPHIHMKYFNR